MENIEFVNKGFRILLTSMSGFIAQEFNRKYKNKWWDEILNCLNDYHLPLNGDYGKLVDSLDYLNCARLIDFRWKDVFETRLDLSCRAWANELKGVRNLVAHHGQGDLDQPTAERGLDTMALLCAQMDPEAAEEIREIYYEVRAKAEGQPVAQVQYMGVAQPMADSGRTSEPGGLLSMVGTEYIQRTELSRKVSYGGKTVAYPVYKVRLDALYYNDQNDRIATWISRYEAENGAGSLSGLSRELYNRIIEGFICDSNFEAIQKTQKNIDLVGQREPGVTLADGRIIDGNRRYTCLRRLQRESFDPLWFETVIMDVDIQQSKKEIKLLELAIQHGEEKKVDYDMIDFAIGTYRDIVQTGLLTVEEYAQGSNETIADVRRRLETAAIVCRFLEYIKLPEQYHVAREYQVYSIFQEMQQIKLPSEDQRQHLEKIVFNNTIMHAIRDQRKFIRDIKALVRSGGHEFYFTQQKELGDELLERFDEVTVHSRKDIDDFADNNADISEDLQLSMERALLRSRAQQLKAKPSENMAKCISMMQEVDPRLFDRLSFDDKEQLKAQLDKIIDMAVTLKDTL